MKLGQISSSDAVTAQVVAAAASRATVLEFAEFYKMIGNADYKKKAATATGGQFRALDNDYADNKVAPEYATPALKILGDKVQVDQAYERRGLDVASERARQLLSFARNLGKQFQNYFFNGDTAVSANQFNGLKKIMPGGQVITASTNGLDVVTGNDNTAKKAQQAFLEALNLLIRTIDGGAQVLFMNGYVLSRLTTIARGFITYQPNEFGVLLPFYNGIPLRDSGFDKTGALIIPNDETCGTGTTCTSIYAARFGEGDDLSLATNIGIEVKDKGLVGVNYEHSVEFDTDLVLLNNKSVAQLKGVIVV